MANRELEKVSEVSKAAPGTQDNPVCLLDVCKEFGPPLLKSWAKEVIDLLPRTQVAQEFGHYNAFAMAGKYSDRDNYG